MPDLNARGFRIAAWLGIVVLIAAVAATAARADWQGAAILSAFAAAAIGFLVERQRLPALFDLLFVCAALLNAAGWVFNMWQEAPWTDPVTHFYTTFAVTLALGFLIYDSVRLQFRSRSVLFIVMISSLGLALGGLWEIFEWTVGVPQSYAAIAMDLIMDTLGALLAGVVSAWVIRQEPDHELRGQGGSEGPDSDRIAPPEPRRA